MYELSVESEFCAAHAPTISGVREQVHGHNWHVTVTIAGDKLDHDGLLCDFHTVEAVLKAVIKPFENADLNAVPSFDRLNQTAEHVARHKAREMDHPLNDSLAPFARVAAVRVTEARGCIATHRTSPKAKAKAAPRSQSRSWWHEIQMHEGKRTQPGRPDHPRQRQDARTARASANGERRIGKALCVPWL